MPAEHKNSKVIFIKRLPTSIHEATNKDPEVKNYFDSAMKSICSYWPKDSMRPGTGLTLGQENLLMSYVLNIPDTDRDFRQKVTDFYHGISTKIEPTDLKGNGGTALEIGLESNNDAEVSKDNLPIKLMDYIRYKHIVSHPEVAESMDLGKGNPLKKYVLFDPEVETKSKIKRSNNNDAAISAYLEVKGNPSKVLQYLTLLKIDPAKYKNEEVVKLKELAERKPTDFLTVHNDKDKEYRYLILDLVTAGVLKSVGTRFMVVETNTQYAGTMEEAIATLKDPETSKQLMIFKSLVQDYKKRKKIPTGDGDLLNFTPNKEVTKPLGSNELNADEDVIDTGGSLSDL